MVSITPHIPLFLSLTFSCRASVFLHFFVLLPYVVLWLLSYGQNCIGISVLAYALFVFAVTVQGILTYDGAAHKGLDPKVKEKAD